VVTSTVQNKKLFDASLHNEGRKMRNKLKRIAKISFIIMTRNEKLLVTRKTIEINYFTVVNQ
jgi:hypothetical protein